MKRPADRPCQIDRDKFAIVAQFFELGRVFDLEALQQKRGIEPGPIQLGDKHANLQLRDVQAVFHSTVSVMKHGGPCGRKSGCKPFCSIVRESGGARNRMTWGKPLH